MSFDQDYHSLLCLRDHQVCWLVETIKVICLFLKTSMSFNQDYYNLLCLRDYQVRWLVETIMVICFLYIFKTIKVCRHAETIMVICFLYIFKTIKVCRHVETIMIICFLYFSKAIKVCCLVETINVFRPFLLFKDHWSLLFQRLSEFSIEASMFPFTLQDFKVFC